MPKSNFKTLDLDPKYVPKKSEKYMCPQQQAYFYRLLTAQKSDLESENDMLKNTVRLANRPDADGTGDEVDNAMLEQEIAQSTKIFDRNENLVKKIDAALERLDNGTFGYSIVSGDEIGLPRMLARPVATMTIEEQEEYEK